MHSALYFSEYTPMYYMYNVQNIAIKWKENKLTGFYIILLF